MKHFISKRFLVLFFVMFGFCQQNSKAQPLDKLMNQRLTEAKQGSIVELPDVLHENYPLINYNKIILPGPQFLISDDPEYIRVPEAIAFKEKVDPGTVRLYLYNVNGVKEPTQMETKIVAVLKNTGSSTMKLRMLKYSSQKPSTNYYQIGKQGLADYFASAPSKEIRSIRPGEYISIDPKLDEFKIKYDELVHGLYEFVIDQPAEISVLQTGPSKSISSAMASAQLLPSKSKTGAGRGKFGVSNYRVTNETVFDTKEGIKQLIVADGKNDPWIKGMEGNAGTVATLDGNYGVMYQIELKWKSSEGKGLALVTWNSRSDNGQWCGGMANSMVISEGKFNEGVIQIPSDRLITKKKPEAVLLQIFKPSADGKEQSIRMTYSPPGASCLPTPLLFIPVDL